jgi:DNA-binding IclR family transcriptional regulator
MTADTTPGKMLRILDLLEESTGHLTLEQLHEGLGYTRSTLYRYLKILGEAGLVASMPELGFTLGPRIAELDYRMRQQDPLIAAARPVMAGLVQAEGGIALLCRRYRDRVLCVHQERGQAAFRSHYERGLARPLYRGAAARVILAHLPAASINRLQAEHAGGFAEAGLGQTPAAAREALRRIRQQGWDVTEGQATPGVTGIAAPLRDAAGEVVGSVSLTLSRARPAEPELLRLVERLRFCAGIIDRTLSQTSR